MLIVSRSAAFNLLYIALTLAMGAAGLPMLLSRRLTQHYVRLWAKIMLALLRAVCGISYEVRGGRHIAAQPVIYASKHQSAWDIFIMVILLPFPAFVLKRELLWIPVTGWYMWRWGVIAINRGRKTRALKAMAAAARKALHARRPLVIYPEGTRRAPGAPPAYRSGVALLYERMKVPVMPVALNSGLFWGRNAFTKKPGTIVIQFLPAIPPGLPPREMMEKLEKAIEEACEGIGYRV